jgi:hypothetical protein
MCDFVSWKEYEGKAYFLTNSDLETKEGRKLLKPGVKDDLCGHGAIENYYSELKGKGQNKECTDFSTPLNFPKEIVEALKKGRLSNIGIALDILNEAGVKQYKKIQDTAWEQYEKIKATALDVLEYAIFIRKIWEQYEKIKATAWEQYKKIQDTAFATIVRQKKYRKIEWQ